MTGMPDEQGQQLWPGHPPGSGQPWASMPPGAPARADAGRPDFGTALAQVLQAIGGLPALDRAGDDIGGLQGLATTLSGLAPVLSGLAPVLSGLAAEAGATRNRPVAQLASLAASIVDGLAADLAMIESALADAAHAASRYGVTIGTDGRPPPVSARPAADATAASEQHWALAYRQAYERAMAEAQQARQRAARQLMALYAGTERPPHARAAGAAKQDAVSPAGACAPRRSLPISYRRAGLEPRGPAVRSQECVVGARMTACGEHLTRKVGGQ
jgi:hypothetical protein